jgi:hypothetical protein
MVTVKNFKYIVLILFFASSAYGKMGVGMNINTQIYYDPPAFTDAIKSASEMFTYTIGGADFNSQQIGNVARDSNGWPLELPYNDGVDDHGGRILFNNCNSGDYVVLWDGTGTVTVGGISSSTPGGVLHATLEGDCTNAWINIASSSVGDPVKNMRIIPAAYEGDEGNMPTFDTLYKQGLENFEVLRFMDFTWTNNSTQSLWADRPTTTYFTQGRVAVGVAWEYAIQLVNELDTNIWINIPENASDNYIDQLATLLLSDLEAGRNVYIEYSNETWNTSFSVYDYLAAFAPGHPNAYVSTALENDCSNQPQRIAYMADRVFTRFNTVWSGQTNRLIRVLAGQRSNSWYIEQGLNYIYNTLSRKYS